MAKAAKRVEETWPASKIEMWSIDKIVPYPKNPREHSAEQVELIARSMKEDGVIAPILVDEKGIIIYGHGRRLGAIKNKFKEYPVCVARGWTEARKSAVRIKDNQLADLSEWNLPLLREEVVDLKARGFDLPLLGFNDTMTLWLTTGELVENVEGEWGGMPGFDQADKSAFKSVLVHFRDQAAVDAFAKLMKQKVTDKTRSMWHPEVEIETYMDKRFVAK